MSAIRNGHVEAPEKLTAHLFVQPSGESGYITVGNCENYKRAQERQMKQHMAADAGARFVDNEQPDLIHDKWEFTVNERGEFMHRLLTLSTAATLVTQALVSAPSGTISFAGVVLGGTYDIGATALNTVVVKVSSVTIAATDYDIDLDNGLLTLHEDAAGIANGNQVDVTFGNALRYNAQFTGRAQPLFIGLLRLEEKNQFSQEPLRVTTFTGVISLKSFPDQTGDFSKVTISVTATDIPVVTKRFGA